MDFESKRDSVTGIDAGVVTSSYSPSLANIKRRFAPYRSSTGFLFLRMEILRNIGEPFRISSRLATLQG